MTTDTALVTATVTYGCRQTYSKLDQWQRDANQWTIELAYDNRTMTLDYFTGQGITEDPTAADVLECLLSDATSADESFEYWCASYGYDTDSRSAERTHNACVEQTRNLRRLLGADFTDALDDPETWIADHTETDGE